MNRSCWSCVELAQPSTRIALLDGMSSIELPEVVRARRKVSLELGSMIEAVGVLTADLAEIAPTVRVDWRKAFLNIMTGSMD